MTWPPKRIPPEKIAELRKIACQEGFDGKLEITTTEKTHWDTDENVIYISEDSFIFGWDHVVYSLAHELSHWKQSKDPYYRKQWQSLVMAYEHNLPIPIAIEVDAEVRAYMLMRKWGFDVTMPSRPELIKRYTEFQHFES